MMSQFHAVLLKSQPIDITRKRSETHDNFFSIV